MKNVGRLSDIKRLEQRRDGVWVARYGFRLCGKDADGNLLATFTASEYPEKPTVEQIRRSLRRYAPSIAGTMEQDVVLDDHIGDYMVY